MLAFFSEKHREAGCDEAGRGCLVGPVCAASVVLRKDFFHPLLNDSKKLTPHQRMELREYIINEAEDYAVSFVNSRQIDEINILNASILAMHKALAKLQTDPELILVDGNRFKSFREIPFQTIIKGDGKYAPIAAASILAKTSRDMFMQKLHERYPQYGWNTNQGYATKKHKEAIKKYGTPACYRQTFRIR